MRAFETVDSFTEPGGRRIALHRRAGDWFVTLDGEELMSSRAPGSEEALARRACAELARHPSPRVLIGGLGLGFTLRAALAALPPRATVVVAELFRQVVDWNRRYLEPALGRGVSDPRTRIVERDVWDAVGEDEIATQGPYQAILVDTDDAPGEHCLAGNARLYSPAGLARLRAALAPGGVLGIWSAYPDPRFVKRLAKAGFAARSEIARSRGTKGAHHTLFLGKR